MRNLVFKALLGSASILGPMAGAAHAQAVTPAAPEAAAAAGGESAEATSDIIVTARRTEERLQDVPISITVYNQQQLSNRNIVNAGDLAIYTPSLSSNGFFGGDSATFAIRGFVQDTGTQPSVGTYFADVVGPRGGGFNVSAGDGAGAGSFFDLQNVQVLKGPQGTLFGRNTTGGAVLLVPQKPTRKLEGYVEGSYGNYDMKRIQAVLNAPIGDSVRFRVGVDRQTRDGYVRNIGPIGPRRFNDVGYTAVRASLVIDLAPNLENYTVVAWQRSSRTGDTPAVTACNPNTVPVGILACAQLAREAATGRAGFFATSGMFADQHTRTTQWQAINTTSWSVSDTLTLKNIVSYGQFRQDATLPAIGTQFDASDLNPVLPLLGFPAGFALPTGSAIDFTGQRPVSGLHSNDQETITEEFRLQGSAGDGKLTYQVGGYLEASNPLSLAGNQSLSFGQCSNYDAVVCTNPLGFAGYTRTFGQTRFRDYGLYAQASYSLTDQLTATGGFRYTWDRTRAAAYLPVFAFPFSPTPVQGFSAGCQLPGLAAPDCQVAYSQRSKAPTWVVGLDYKPTEDVLLYGKYARGYRAGGIAPNTPAEYAVFRPEKVDSYEVGLKSSFRGPVRGTFNVSGFYNDFSNQQLTAYFSPKDPLSGLNPTSGILNLGKSRIYGVEVEASITPFTGFTIDAGYTYLKTKVGEVQTVAPDPASPFDVTTVVLPGDPLALSPKNKVSVTATYRLPIDESIGRVSLGATFTHVDKQLSHYTQRDANLRPTGLSYIQPRDLLNLNISWNSVAGLPIDLSAFATNVTNEKYYAATLGLLSIGYDGAQIGEPRMYGGRLRYRFGN